MYVHHTKNHVLFSGVASNVYIPQKLEIGVFRIAILPSIYCIRGKVKGLIGAYSAYWRDENASNVLVK